MLHELGIVGKQTSSTNHLFPDGLESEKIQNLCQLGHRALQ